MDYDWELERALLGGLLIQEGLFLDLGLVPEDFHRPAHQGLYALLQEGARKRELQDLALVLSRLAGSPQRAEQVGGVAYVATLPAACPSTEALPGYARRLRALSHRRQVRRLAQELAASTEEEEAVLRARGQELVQVLARAPTPLLPWNRGISVREPPPPDWLFVEPGAGGVLPVGKVGLLAAPGGVGKSSALAWLALAIATGRPWFGLSIPRPGAVALILGEETSADVLRKLYFGARALHLTADELEAVQQRVFSMGTAGTDVALLQADRQGQLHPSPFAEQLSRDLSEKGPWRAILLDPLSRFSHAETEIDAAAATRTVEALERLSALPGTPAVLVAHHTRKLGRAEGATGDDIRGSSALRDGVRWAAVLEALEAREGDPRLPPQAQGAVRLSVVKSNVGRVPAPAIALREGGGALRDATPGEGRGLVEKAVPSPTRSSRRMDVKNDD